MKTLIVGLLRLLRKRQKNALCFISNEDSRQSDKKQFSMLRYPDFFIYISLLILIHNNSIVRFSQN